VLLPAGAVIFDDGKEVSVRELLTDGSAYDDKTYKDPVEIGGRHEDHIAKPVNSPGP